MVIDLMASELVYQPNCVRCDAWGCGVRLDRGGQVIEREPVCVACGALAPPSPPPAAADGASPSEREAERRA